mgnify:CR=1 FL=1
MKRYRIRLTREAESDLVDIYRFVRRRSASNTIARRYTGRIRGFLEGLETFGERGTIHEQIRPGLRVIGFERRISVAFVVEGGRRCRPADPACRKTVQKR